MITDEEIKKAADMLNNAEVPKTDRWFWFDGVTYHVDENGKILSKQPDY